MSKKRSEERNPQVVDDFYEMINKHTNKPLFSKKTISEEWNDDTLQCGLFFWNIFYDETDEIDREGHFSLVAYSIAIKMRIYCKDKGLEAFIFPEETAGAAFNIKRFMALCIKYTEAFPVPEYNKCYEEILKMPYEKAIKEYSDKEFIAAQKYKKKKLKEQNSVWKSHIKTANKTIRELNKEISDYQRKIDANEAEIKKK